MKNMDITTSRIVEFLRFPLIFAVIFIHSISMGGDSDILIVLRNLISNTICHIAVPLFFIISGYLFFINIDSFNYKIYIRKLRGRFKTLVVPYLFWNLIFILFIALGQLLLPSLFTGSFKAVKDFSVYEWISMFWSALGSGEPVSFQLWFLRDLIAMVILFSTFLFFRIIWTLVICHIFSIT